MVSSPFVSEGIPVLQRVISVYSSERPYNDWSSVCVTYNYEELKSGQVRKMLSFLATMTLLPTVICSNCPPCPKPATFGIKLGHSKISIRLNASNELHLPFNPFCVSNNCEKLKNTIQDALEYSIKIYVDSLFVWQNSTYVEGFQAVFLGLIADKMNAPIEYIVPNRRFAERQLHPGLRQLIKTFKLDRVTVGSPSSADLNLNLIKISADYVSPNREQSALSALSIDTFRVAIILPKRQFTVDKIFTIIDNFYLFGFGAYVIFSYIGRKLIFEDPTAPSFLGLLSEIFFEMLGQSARQPPRRISICISKGVYYFFVYIYCVVYTGRIFALMSNCMAEKPVSSLRTINDSHLDIVLTAPILQRFPEVYDLVVQRMREPVTLTPREFEARIATDQDVFATIFTQSSLRRRDSIALQSRGYRLVRERFGKFNLIAK